MVQTQPASTTKPEVRKAPGISAGDAARAEWLKEERLQEEAAAREAAKASFRLNTVSYGEGRPIATRHDDASWAKNRRS